MKILVISQVFYPDTVSVAQHLSDLCFKLSENQHEVTVFTSKFAYENKGIKYVRFEQYKNVRILRLESTGLGKKNNLFRFIDFLTFNLSVFFNLLKINRHDFDLIIGLTAPPLLSYFGSKYAKRKGIKFCYWLMDMQPELAISSGLIKKGSIISKYLLYLGNEIINNSDSIIVLDKYMFEYLVSRRNADKSKVKIAPVWPVVETTYIGSRLDNPFRKSNGFQDKIVIMYSGNHSYVHPLDTLLECAKLLCNDNRFLFVFIGGGVRKKDVSDFKRSNNLDNILQLPYQPRESIHLSLGASDIQVVIMGDGQVSFTHPNKIYGALYLGKPVIYIGPPQSHVTDILNNINGNICVNHGESDLLKERILSVCEDIGNLKKTGIANQEYARRHFSPGDLLNRMSEIIESHKELQ